MLILETYIYSNDFELSNKLKSHIKDKAFKTFYRFENLIRKLEIRISDENGPKGGEDKSCVVCVKIVSLPDIIVKDIESDAYAAISRSIARAKRTLARRLKQSQSFNKERLQFETTDLIYTDTN